MDLQVIWNLFFNDPSDDDDDFNNFRPERERHFRIGNFYETVVPTYSITGKRL